MAMNQGCTSAPVPTRGRIGDSISELARQFDRLELARAHAIGLADRIVGVLPAQECTKVPVAQLVSSSLCDELDALAGQFGRELDRLDAALARIDAA